jgi:hypothetical protein
MMNTKQLTALRKRRGLLAAIIISSILLAGALVVLASRHSGATTSSPPSVRRTTSKSSSAPVIPPPLTTAAVAPGPSTTTAGSAAQPVTVVCPSGGRTVHSGTELQQALSTAGPGAVIHMADGTYSGHFTIATSATLDKPAWLCGGSGAVLNGGSLKVGYALHLQGGHYWRIVGFSVTNAQKGVVLDGTTHAVVQGLTVHLTGDEGIHLRSASNHNLVLDNTVANTGQHSAKFGEGIYVGSAKKNWCLWSGCQPDHSDYNVVANNTISDTTAENIDIKEGTTGGQILNNSLNGAGLSGADSWVDVKGNNWLIAGNRGSASPNDGFQTHEILPGWGSNNVFKDNASAVDGPGYAIHLTPVNANIVSCTNTQTGAALGLSNIACTK